MLRHECGVKPKRAAKMRVADSVNRNDMVRSCSVLVSRGQTLFRAGRYRLQHKRLCSVAYTASDNALRGRGVWLRETSSAMGCADRNSYEGYSCKGHKESADDV